MPSFDGGHYFLTTLAPVLAEPCPRADGSLTSPVASLRETLATLPSAVESAASLASGRSSPFARSAHTHFARWAVIDQPAFNGRDPGNALAQAIGKTDLLAHGPVDRLTRAWLLLAIDCDATDAPDHGLGEYLARLWDVMGEELRAVYRHCHGFGAVTDREGFARYIRRCEVETTMPFNDYWITPPPLPSLSLAGVALAAVAFVAFVTWLAARLAGGWGAAVAALAALGLAGWAAYRLLAVRAQRPFPAAPGSDLPTILKALFLQNAFAGFAIAHQGAGPAELHAAFGRFLADTRPPRSRSAHPPAGHDPSVSARRTIAADLDLADIQGNILTAYGRLGFPKARFLLLTVRDPAAGRALVERLWPRVTTALRWPSSKPNRPVGADPVPRPEVALNLAFTFRGLLALGVPTRTLRGMPDEFIDGMAARAAILGGRHMQ